MSKKIEINYPRDPSIYANTHNNAHINAYEDSHHPHRSHHHE